MTSINIAFAINCLWQALEWEPVEITELFDQIACRLRRNPRFSNMPISEIDLLLADARREFEQDMDDFESRLVRAFKDAIISGRDTDEVAA
jgi:hypothetical protein